MIASAIRNRRSYSRAGAILVILFIGVGVLASKAKKTESSSSNAEKVSLKISTVIGAPTTTLALTVANNSKEELKTWPLGGMRHNCVVIMKPNGEEKELWVGIDSDVEPVIVKPTESFTWKIDISRRIGLYGGSLQEPGLYRLYWKLKELKADDVAREYKSNEILLLREKGGEQ